VVQSLPIGIVPVIIHAKVPYEVTAQILNQRARSRAVVIHASELQHPHRWCAPQTGLAHWVAGGVRTVVAQVPFRRELEVARPPWACGDERGEWSGQIRGQNSSRTRGIP
jgi:hypothetical protein